MSNKKIIKEMYKNKLLNKEDNYNSIMKKINSNKIIKRYKYAFIPVCLILIIGNIIMFQYNVGNLKFSDKKPINNIGTDIKDLIPRENIRMVMGSGEASWAYEVDNVEKEMERSEYVVKIKILNIGMGTFDYFTGRGSNFMPKTPIKIEKIEIFKGKKNIKIDTIIKDGGYVTVRQVMNVSLDDRNDKMGLTKLSEKEKDEKYMYFEGFTSFNFELGETYIVFLNKSSTEDLFFLPASGFSIFKEDLDNPNQYKNVITGNLLYLDDIN